MFDFFNKFKLFFYAGIVIVILGLLTMLLRTQLKLANERQDALEQSIARHEAVQNQLEADINNINRISTEMHLDFNRVENNLASLNRRIRDRNLRQETIAQPNAVQDQINAETRFMLRCNELVSGSPVLPSDAGNTICPELVPAQ